VSIEVAKEEEGVVGRERAGGSNEVGGVAYRGVVRVWRVIYGENRYGTGIYGKGDKIMKEDFVLFCLYVEDSMVLLMYSNVLGEVVRKVGRTRSQWGDNKEGNLSRSGGGSWVQSIS